MAGNAAAPVYLGSDRAGSTLRVHSALDPAGSGGNLGASRTLGRPTGDPPLIPKETTDRGCSEATRLARPPGGAASAPGVERPDARGVRSLPRDDAAASRLPELRLAQRPAGDRAQADHDRHRLLRWSRRSIARCPRRPALRRMTGTASRSPSTRWAGTTARTRSSPAR